MDFITRFIGTRRVQEGDPQIGEVFFTTKSIPATYEFAGDELFVRAGVVSPRQHPNPYKAGDMEMAWT